ncbi:hypothetical protein M422DRAFT_253242 [Sphaerobolus stellatus SS14]|uniref:Uncharacterized protein n=1 Tax=Sphaerobolus stellatus (strain SS14) TaxID=990650 RepID=A0A0C9VWY9_SPHS4|nr:hypothetical protein M422DRAFT_253242 [Sphaerobolus stellatus SS14]
MSHFNPPQASRGTCRPDVPCNPAHVSPHHPKLVKFRPQDDDSKAYYCGTCDEVFKDIEHANDHVFKYIGIFICPLSRTEYFTSANALNKHFDSKECRYHYILFDNQHRTINRHSVNISDTPGRDIHQVFPVIDEIPLSRGNKYKCTCSETKSFSNAHHAKQHVIHESYIYCCGTCHKLFKRPDNAENHCASATPSTSRREPARSRYAP